MSSFSHISRNEPIRVVRWSFDLKAQSPVKACETLLVMIRIRDKDSRILESSSVFPCSHYNSRSVKTLKWHPLPLVPTSAMDTKRGFFGGPVARTLLGLNNFIILASSIILTGILSYFLHWGYRGTHVTYNEVIVCPSQLQRATDWC